LELLPTMSDISERSRLDSIIQMLKMNTSASIGEIAEAFHVSQMTIRRDIQKLVHRTLARRGTKLLRASAEDVARQAQHRQRRVDAHSGG
jgi:DeoR/GlpR family transcriptional regulator of sugar metabolism